VHVSRAGERVFAIADFPFKFSIARQANRKERLFRRNAETNTRDTCATPSGAAHICVGRRYRK
jgi:hypothetical protein